MANFWTSQCKLGDCLVPRFNQKRGAIYSIPRILHAAAAGAAVVSRVNWHNSSTRCVPCCVHKQSLWWRPRLCIAASGRARALMSVSSSMAAFLMSLVRDKVLCGFTSLKYIFVTKHIKKNNPNGPVVKACMVAFPTRESVMRRMPSSAILQLKRFNSLQV